MRLAFLGTPDFAAPTLAALLKAGHAVVGVYSQPAAPRGRGQVLKPTPVQAFAGEHGLEVRTPASLAGLEELAAFRALDLEAAVVVAFGQILSEEILQTPRLGAFNLHGSLLPRWRGAAPIQRAIMAGDAETGVAVMRMTAGLDEGPVLASLRLPIGPLDTAGTVQERMARDGAGLMVRTLGEVASGKARETPQAAAGVTYARKIRASETRIRWRRPAVEVDRRVRGLSPAPGAWFLAPSERGPVRVKALLTRFEDREGAPGTVIDDDFLVACGGGAVRILTAQREGRSAQDAATFLRGFPLGVGTQLA